MTTTPTNIKVSKFVATDALIRDNLVANNLRVRNSTVFDHIINCQTLQANRIVVPYTGTTGEVIINGNLTVTGGTTIQNLIINNPTFTGTTTMDNLVVTGAATINNLNSATFTTTNLSLPGTLNVGGATTLGSTLNQIGNATFGGSVNFLGTTTLNNLAITNLSLPGTLQVSGAASLNSLNMSGNTTINGSERVLGSLSVVGAASLNILAIQNLTVPGVLLVGGATTLGSTLNQTGNSTLSGTLNVLGAATLGSTLNQIGNATFSGNVNVLGTMTLNNVSVTNLSLPGTLQVSGASSLNALNVTGNATLNGNERVTGLLQVSGASSLNTLNVTGNATLNSNEIVQGTLNVLGASTLNAVSVVDATDSTSVTTGAIVCAGGVGITKQLRVSDNLTISNNLSVRFIDTGATARSILMMDSSNSVRLRGGVTAALFIAPDASATSLEISFNSSIITTIYYAQVANLQVLSTGVSIPVALSTGTSSTATGITMFNSTASYAPSILNYYEETASVNLNFTGAWTATKTVTLTRIGRIVTAAFATGTSSATGAASLTSGANIPARFRPVAAHTAIVQVVDNAATTTTPGNLQVATTGIVTVFSNAAAGTFTNGAVCGYNSFCTTWQVA
jgi:hypothetical protein